MADLYPACGVGDSPWAILVMPFKCEAAVTKGRLVELNTHTSGELGSVSQAAAGSKKAVGVALKSGAIGDIIPVLIMGIVKVTGSGAITLGTKIASAANGVPTASAALDAPAAYNEAAMQTELDKIEARIGIALQTFADGDSGLIFVTCSLD